MEGTWSLPKKEPEAKMEKLSPSSYCIINVSLLVKPRYQLTFRPGNTAYRGHLCIPASKGRAKEGCEAKQAKGCHGLPMNK